MRFLLVGLALLFTVPAHAGKSPPKLVLGIHIQTSGEGLPDSQARSISVPPNGEQIMVRTLPEVTQQNLIGVESTPGGTLLTFDHQGQINLSTVTAANQGRILVVLLNGYVIYAPLIDEEIPNGVLLIPHPMNAQIVQLLKDEAASNVREHHRT